MLLLLASAAARADDPARDKQLREPSARQVVQMALDAAKDGSPRRTEALMRRARLSGLVPTLRLSADRGLQQDLSATSTVQTERQRESLADDFSVQASLTFDLPRLVFASEEVRLLSIRRWLAQEKRKLIEDVVRLYFERRRLLRSLAQGQGDDLALGEALGEVEALLDAFTDGAFGAAVVKRAHD